MEFSLTIMTRFNLFASSWYVYGSQNTVQVKLEQNSFELKLIFFIV